MKAIRAWSSTAINRYSKPIPFTTESRRSPVREGWGVRCCRASQCRCGENTPEPHARIAGSARAAADSSNKTIQHEPRPHRWATQKRRPRVRSDAATSAAGATLRLAEPWPVRSREANGLVRRCVGQRSRTARQIASQPFAYITPWSAAACGKVKPNSMIS